MADRASANTDIERDVASSDETRVWTSVPEVGFPSNPIPHAASYLSREPIIESQEPPSASQLFDSAWPYLYTGAVPNTYQPQPGQSQETYGPNSADASRDSSAILFTPLQSTRSDTSAAVPPFRRSGSQQGNVARGSRLQSFTPSADEFSWQQETPSQSSSSNIFGQSQVGSFTHGSPLPSFTPSTDETPVQWMLASQLTSSNNSGQPQVASFSHGSRLLSFTPSTNEMPSQWMPPAQRTSPYFFGNFEEQSLMSNAAYEDNASFPSELNNTSEGGGARTSYRDSSTLPIGPPPSFGYLTRNTVSSGPAAYSNLQGLPSTAQSGIFSFNGLSDAKPNPSNSMPPDFDFTSVEDNSSVIPLRSAPERRSFPEDDQQGDGSTLQIVPYEGIDNGRKKQRKGVEITNHKVADPMIFKDAW